MSWWDCEHGKANNVFQYLKNHDEEFYAPIVFNLPDLEYELNLFSFLESVYDKIQEGKPELAVRLIEALATLMYESAVELDDSAKELHEEVEEFLRTYNDKDDKDE